MTKAFPYIALFGGTLSPRDFTAATGLAVARGHEPGSTREHARDPRKGELRDHGRVVLEAPADLDGEAQVEWLLDVAIRHADSFKALGATNGKFHVTYAYSFQCNLEYDATFLNRIARTGMSFTITCDENESEYTNLKDA